MVLEQFKKDSGETLDGYIGGRLPKQMELDFKEVCKKNNIKVAEALRILIAAELNQLSIPAAKAAITPPIPPAAPIHSLAFPVAGSQVGAYVVKENGKKRLPCPVCGTWSNYSTFKDRHTKKHGFSDTVEFMEANLETVVHMIKEKSQE